MKLGFVSDSLGSMRFEHILEEAARMGVSGIEVNRAAAYRAALRSRRYEG